MPAVIGGIWQQPVVIVASTLVIATLFQPSQQRFQTIVDRRFYRRKHGAANFLENYRSF